MFKSYVFDLDQNILNTKTPIHLLVHQADGSRKEEAIPNADFETRLQDKEHVKYHENSEISFREFRGYGKLIKDVFEAIDNEDYGPSWQNFKTATIEATPTHIITARGNPMEEFREMHKKIIYEVLNKSEREEMVYNMVNHTRYTVKKYETLIEHYLNNNLYIPCADPDTINKFRRGKKSSYEKKAAGFEKCIKQTIDTYTSYYGKPFMKNRHFTIGFSDDGKKNIDAITQQIIEKLANKYPNIRFYLYNTQNPKLIRTESIQKKSNSRPLF